MEALKTETAMTEIKLLEIIGTIEVRAVVKHHAGDAALHSRGFVSADPCYILDEPAYRAFCDVVERQGLFKRATRSWQVLQYAGHTVYWHACDDGHGPLGHGVDSGQVVAIPLAFCNATTQEILTRAKRQP